MQHIPKGSERNGATADGVDTARVPRARVGRRACYVLLLGVTPWTDVRRPWSVLAARSSLLRTANFQKMRPACKCIVSTLSSIAQKKTASRNLSHSIPTTR